MNVVNVFQAITVTQLLLNASVTADADGTSIDLKDYEGDAAVVCAVGTPTAGTDPTMDIKLQDSADNSSFADVSGLAITQVTTPGGTQTIKFNTNEVRRYVRHVLDIGGTSSPAFPVALTFLGVKKYLG